jgi:hypothetical protein
MLYRLGFSETCIWHFTFIEQVHQSVMRTSLRRPDRKDPIELIVPDKATAIEVGRIIGEGVKIERLGSVEVIERVNKLPPFTRADKDRRYQYNKTRHALFANASGSGHQQEIRPLSHYKRSGSANHNNTTNGHKNKASKVNHVKSQINDRNEQTLLMTYHETFYANTTGNI